MDVCDLSVVTWEWCKANKENRHLCLGLSPRGLFIPGFKLTIAFTVFSTHYLSTHQRNHWPFIKHVTGGVHNFIISIPTGRIRVIYSARINDERFEILETRVWKKKNPFGFLKTIAHCWTRAYCVSWKLGLRTAEEKYDWYTILPWLEIIQFIYIYI